MYIMEIASNDDGPRKHATHESICCRLSLSFILVIVKVYSHVSAGFHTIIPMGCYDYLVSLNVFRINLHILRGCGNFHTYTCTYIEPFSTNKQ